MQAIQDRVDDAVLLWREGRREGAFLLALVAVAARARLDYPQPMRDQEAFLRYLEPHGFYWRNMKVEFRGELREVAAIFYKWLRCELVHEGGLPVDVQFEEDEERLGVRAGGAPAFTLLLTTGWFFKLLDVALLPQVGQQGVNTTT